MARETFRFAGTRWDVDAAHEIVCDGRQPVPFRVARAASVLPMIRHDPDWALAEADMSRPCLLVPFAGGVLPIDGWHRIARADAEGVALLRGYLLTDEEEQRVRL